MKSINRWRDRGRPGPQPSNLIKTMINKKNLSFGINLRLSPSLGKFLAKPLEAPRSVFIRQTNLKNSNRFERDARSNTILKPPTLIKPIIRTTTMPNIIIIIWKVSVHTTALMPP